MGLTAEQVACCSALGGSGSTDTFACTGIPISGSPFTGISFTPCNYNNTAVEEEVVNSNPFDWNGLLSTLGAIAVPFLPFLFGTAGSSPPTSGDNNTEQLKSQQGMVIIVGFVILIALSVGAYILIKKRR